MIKSHLLRVLTLESATGHERWGLCLLQISTLLEKLSSKPGMAAALHPLALNRKEECAVLAEFQNICIFYTCPWSLLVERCWWGHSSALGFFQPGIKAATQEGVSWKEMFPGALFTQ